ncbi:MAG: leucine-rich repeat protein [Lachnospiraceae bacterium]|nr:leucine-rich repeat protein [Lachnospiraceae bacterium]
MKKRIVAIIMSVCMASVSVELPALAEGVRSIAVEETWIETVEGQILPEEESIEAEVNAETQDSVEEPETAISDKATSERVTEELEAAELEEQAEASEVEEEGVAEDVSDLEKEELYDITRASIVDSGSCGANVTWTLDSDGVLTISGTGPMTDYATSYDWFGQKYPDAPWKAYMSEIKKVLIKSGVTDIGDGAFLGCENISNVEIANSVGSIGWEAFEDCTSLSDIMIPDRVVVIGYGAFRRCSSMTSIKIPNDVRSIGEAAFAGTGIISIELPDSVTHMGVSVFEGCMSLTSVKFGDITSIPKTAFRGCSSLVSIGWSDSITSIEEEAFAECTSLTNVVIPDNVNTIEGHAFMGCSSLKSVVIPGSITVLRGFNNCESLTDVKISYGVKEIDAWAFRGCDSLEHIELPDSVTVIEAKAFASCDNLTSIKIPNSVRTIGESAFHSCYNLRSIKIPSGITEIKDSTFERCRALSSLIIPNGVKEIGGHSFNGCISLTCIEIPSSVTSIGSYAFGSREAGREIYPCDFYFMGTENQWNAIDIKEGNFYSDDTIHFGMPMPIEVPEELTLSSVTYTYHSKEVNVLTSMHFIEPSHAPFTLMCTAKSPEEITEYELLAYTVNKCVSIAKSTDGVFKDIDANKIPSGAKLCIYTSNGTDIVENKILLMVTANTIPAVSSLSLGTGSLDLKIDEDVPLVGGLPFKLSLPASLPVSCEIEEGKIKLGINIKKEAYSSNSNEGVTTKQKSLKEQYEGWRKDLLKTDYIRQDYKGWLANTDIKQDFPLHSEKVVWNICGYAEGEWSDSLEKLSGEITIVISGAETFQHQFVTVVPITVNCTLGASLGGDIKGGYDFTAKEWFGEAKLIGSININPYIGPGVGTYLSAGVYGNVAANVELGIVLQGDKSGMKKTSGLDTVALSGQAGVRFYLAKKEYSVTLITTEKLNRTRLESFMEGDRLLLYSVNKNSVLNRMDAVKNSMPLQQVADPPILTAIDVMDERARTVETVDALFVNKAGADGAVLENIYGGAEPKLVTAGGNTLLIYTGSDNSRAEANQTAVYYASYNSAAGAFGSPKVLAADGTADYHPQVVSYGNDIYVVYQDSQKQYGAGDDPELSEYAASFGVCVAKYDAVRGRFDEIGTFYDGKYCFQPAMYADENGCTLVWLENSAGNIFGAEGSNILKSATYSGGKWSSPLVLKSGLKMVTSLAVGETDGAVTVVYAEDEDNDLTTPQQTLRCLSGGEVTASREHATVSNLTFLSVPGSTETVLCGNDSGALVTFDGALAGTMVLPEGTMDSGSPVYAGSDAVYYMKTGENGTRDIACSCYIEGAWYDVTLTEESEYVDSFCVENGKVVYLLTDAKSLNDEEWDTVSKIKLLLSDERTGLKLSYAAFEGWDVVPGDAVEYTVGITNNGTKPVAQVPIVLYPEGRKGDGVSHTVTARIMPGETVETTVSFDAPVALDDAVYVMQVSEEDGEGIRIDLSQTDIRVDSEYTITEEGNYVKAIVDNYSYVSSDFVLSVKDAEGNSLFTTADTINGQGSREYLVEVPEDILPDGKMDTLVYLTVTTDAEEYYLSNNACEQRIVDETYEAPSVVRELPKVKVTEIFNDIKESHWWVDAVQYAYDYDLMAGMGASFKPAGKLTREQFVQVLYNNSGTPAVSGVANKFADVKEGQWYTNAVLWANHNDIANGNADGTFGVGNHITREALALMLYKYAKLNNYDLSYTDGLINQYADGAKVSSWAAEALNWAVSQGIMSGKGSGGALSSYRLDPQGSATRAECASMMMKLLSLSRE